MILIKNSILYFIQITHTDDFLSTGDRLVTLIPCSTGPLVEGVSEHAGIASIPLLNM